MAEYEYRKMVQRHWYGRFKSRRRAIIIFVSTVVLVGLVLLIDLTHSNNKSKPTSAVQNVTVEDAISTFSNGVFSFKDTGKWVLNRQESSDSKYIYYKFHGADVQSQLIVYVNQVPIPLYLATSRVLPIRIVNNDSFDVTSVSGPCVGSYAVGELHKVMIVTINGAEMLCDPDTPQYSIQLSEVDGNYQLHMQRSDGTPLSTVITYKDYRIDPGAENLVRIANSFKVL